MNEQRHEQADRAEQASDAAAEQAREPEAVDPPQPPKTKRAVMRIPAAATVGIGLLVFGMTPIAWTVPGLLLLYVIPVVLLYYVLRLRTTATPEGLATRSLFATRNLSWTQLRGLTVTRRGKVYAVTSEEENVLLPAVRSTNLPTLSLISGGRLPDPSGLTSQLGGDKQPEGTAGAQ